MAGVLAISGLSLGCGRGPVDTTGASAVVALTGSASAGSVVFAQECSECHGASGTGGQSGSNLQSFAPTYTDLELAGIMLNGYGDMPALERYLTDQEAADVIAHLRATFP